MKKTMFTLTIMLTAAALIAAFSSPATAAVKGVCSDCHTMHNSQGGTPMRWDEEGTPLSALLRGTCLGCHTTDGALPYGPVNGADYPYVMQNAGTFTDDKCLAGGFFTHNGDPADDNSDKNHSMGTTALPAGYAAEGLGDWYEGDTEGFGCAGSNGCHGRHEAGLTDDMAAIKGGHHDPSPLAYRMLYVSLDMSKPVIGVGASDYEHELIGGSNPVPQTTDPHNTYSAQIGDYSISELCAICHGDFHNESTAATGDCGSASPWLRHPTDVAIPSDWTIGAAAYVPDGDDLKHNPVGYAGAVVDEANKKATCVSCHRAHGTDNLDLLRWSYDTQYAGLGDSANTYGCLGCHDRQR